MKKFTVGDKVKAVGGRFPLGTVVQVKTKSVWIETGGMVELKYKKKDIELVEG